MIIFNLLAIPVAILVALIWFALEWVMPGITGSEYGPLLFFSVAFAVSGVSELVGLAGRLFWMPMWFLTLLGWGVSAWQLWGTTGAIVAGCLVIAGIVGMVWFSKHAAKKKWERAPQTLQEARRAISAGQTEKSWELLEESYCTTFSDKYPPEKAKHNAAVLAEALELGREVISDAHQQKLSGLIDTYKQGAASMSEIETPDSLADWAATLLIAEGTPEDDD